jgi:hypothetical protein
MVSPRPRAGLTWVRSPDGGRPCLRLDHPRFAGTWTIEFVDGSVLAAL